jgi:ParB/RepB/Spo0J family partition protein
MSTKRSVMKDPGLIGAHSQTLRHHVPNGVSGVDVSKAVARMPSFDNDDDDDAPPAAPGHAGDVSGREIAPTPPSAPLAAGDSANQIFLVNVDLLDDSPYQPRRHYDEETLSELGQSLLVHQEEPIIVRAKPNGRYELVSGHRRTRGARMWEKKQLEARLFTRSDAEAAVSALVTNEAREDLSDYERGLKYAALVESGKNGDGVIKNFEQLAQRMSKSKALISRRVALTKLPSYVLKVLDVHPRAVTINNVAELNKVLDQPHDQEKLVQELLRVALGEISMTALTSIMAASRVADGQPAGAAKTQQLISLQSGSTVYAQIARNDEKRKLTISLPNEKIDLAEVGKLVADALAAKYGEESK